MTDKTEKTERAWEENKQIFFQSEDKNHKRKGTIT